MEFDHKPVLLEECLEYLNIKPDGVYVDGTVGGAGHSAEILKRLNSNGLLIGLDQDRQAVEASCERLRQISSVAKWFIENENFRDLRDVMVKYNLEAADGIIFDLGASSHQFDEESRGFSYRYDAPLDMRMNLENIINAAIIVNEFDEKNIYEIIRDYGEEKWASRIACFIAEARKNKKILTTFELVDIIKAAIPHNARREGPHPAKRTFQALRIAVNDELGALRDGITVAFDMLRPSGRLCIITFHSLEDRIVKTEFQKKVRPCTCPHDFPVCICGKKQMAEHITAKPVQPGDREIQENPRARSAKLRVIRKIK